MRVIGGEIRSRLFFPLVSLLTAICLTPSLPWRAVAQKTNQQRPRRVSGGETQQPAPQSSNSNSAAEEVDEGDVVRVDTQLVSVPAVVTNTAGRPLTELGRDNFIVYEDGQRQTISNFGTTATPFEIALLLDTSGSTRADVALIRQAARAFVAALRSGDRVAVVAFNTAEEGQTKMATVEVLSALTDDREALDQAIGNLGSSNGTPFYDALARVNDLIFREPPRDDLRGRRAVVALTDGVDSSSDSDFGAVRGMLTAAGIACYFIQVNTEDFVEDRLMRDCQDDGRLSLSQKQLERYRQIFAPSASAADYANFCQMGPFERMHISRELYSLARREMDDLARASGGRNFVATSLQAARAAFTRVAAEIGTQYSLGYYPANKSRDGKFRVIKVEVKGVKEKTEVRAREGYFAPRR